jgi:hypothetical protein
VPCISTVFIIHKFIEIEPRNQPLIPQKNLLLKEEADISFFTKSTDVALKITNTKGFALKASPFVSSAFSFIYSYCIA